jgi:flagellum-specific peptidoglycan hydrolase FlgJ
LAFQTQVVGRTLVAAAAITLFGAMLAIPRASDTPSPLSVEAAPNGYEAPASVALIALAETVDTSVVDAPPVGDAPIAETGEAEPAVQTIADTPVAAVTGAVAESSAGQSADVGRAPEPAQNQGPTYHTIQPGENLRSIAVTFSQSVDAIAAANGIGDPDSIQAGRQLFIPAPGANPTPPQRQRAPGTSQEVFIAQVVPGAQQSQKLTGVPASVTIAQAILESFWGTSYLAKEANNLFGVKAHTKPGPAGVVWIDAWEVEDGVSVTRSEPFRKYNSVAESIVDHGMFFVENRRYRSALAAADDPKEFARRINIAGYATDPAYAGKLISFMDRYNLYQYDAY